MGLAHSSRVWPGLGWVWILWANMLGSSGVALADTITLANGRVIEAERAWYEGKEVRYSKGGGTYGLPRTSVRSVDQSAPFAPSTDPDILRGRALLSSGDALEAFKAAQVAMRRDATSVPALQLLGESQLALGDARGARQSLERARLLDDRDPRTLASMGDALSALGDRAGAETLYRRSLALHPNAALAGADQRPRCFAHGTGGGRFHVGGASDRRTDLSGRAPRIRPAHSPAVRRLHQRVPRHGCGRGALGGLP